MFETHLSFWLSELRICLNLVFVKILQKHLIEKYRKFYRKLLSVRKVETNLPIDLKYLQHIETLGIILSKIREK